MTCTSFIPFLRTFELWTLQFAAIPPPLPLPLHPRTEVANSVPPFRSLSTPWSPWSPPHSCWCGHAGANYCWRTLTKRREVFFWQKKIRPPTMCACLRSRLVFKGAAWLSYGAAWLGYGAAWLSMARRGSANGVEWLIYGAAWLSYGAAWLSMVRCGSAWRGVVQLTARRLVVGQARVRFSARHHR
jgi:hypothetical protein